MGIEVGFRELVEATGKAIDLAGVLVLVVSAVVFTLLLAYRLIRRRSMDEAYHSYRRSLGRGILVGLELLIAGDIIRTVAIEPTFHSVGVLAAIVLIRTFLSFALELEIGGRWPWEARD